MRIAPPLLGFVAAACLTLGCALAQQLTQGGNGTGAEGGAATDAAGDSSVVGAGCGIESGSGAQLCRATSLCPMVQVDSESFPHCGFRIKGGASELVCGCGDQVCSMGPFTTCQQAASLLAAQSEAAVCTQVGEDRCTKVAPPAGSSGTSGSSGPSGGGPTCDHSCLQECGCGAGCAAVCGCK